MKIKHENDFEKVKKSHKKMNDVFYVAAFSTMLSVCFHIVKVELWDV